MIIMTGVSGGIGRELVMPLLEMDMVVGIYNKTLPEFPSHKNLILEQLNLEDPLAIQSFVQRWKDKLSKLVLLHFAGVKIDGIAANYNETDWDHVLGVNLKGDFLLSQALLPQMIEARWGRIVHVSSLGAIQGSPGTIAYSASKSGLLGMSRVLAKEYGRFNITSNVITLGYFEKGMLNKLNEQQKKEILNQIPTKTFGDVSNIVNAIEFLIKSDYVNGSAISIDGGV
ncbi:MAG: SDR family NAD(P)-dependent oxidoreductase [Candidatus Omnitrophica bacterium]|nr:SDR family NAD(P)-dependent oxidoreductase [Candidatus Omnitrophota bacterium]